MNKHMILSRQDEPKPQFYVFRNGELASEHLTQAGAVFAAKKGGTIYLDRKGTRPALNKDRS